MVSIHDTEVGISRSPGKSFCFGALLLEIVTDTARFLKKLQINKTSQRTA